MNEVHPMIWIILTGVTMFIAQVAVDTWKNRNSKMAKIETLLEKLIESFHLFVADSMSKNGLRGQSPDKFYVKRSSPIALTTDGENLATDSGIKQYLQNNLNTYSRHLKRYNDDLDILNACRRLAFTKLDDRTIQDIREIRQYSYNNGVSLLVMREVFALTLRDLYLDKIK